MIQTTCYRDLTRKTKIKGLTSTSWFALIILGFIAWFFLVLYSLIVIVFLYCFFFILEFFDEDIYQIIIAKFSLPQNKFFS
ncbi:hypothetical protein AJY52_07625 [Campylobacter lari]|uniref:hypothetical protein n=1 Tax=Campylobacter sp. CNRCH_2007_0968H TaxID=2911598 RepID=UPI000875412A|nr:hypothetical protein [Campylobacter sp. CNRCH_2007_0968H]EAI7263283.1 hypothetical protein [Campylobacter lari]EAK0768232.1 hypothetical protein [Campylobacter lari]MCV3399077.1 hypothetical protein [Campylobacter lari]MCV3481690.1 hypothetical protein [Campylobacter lari]MCV3531290.1 hypothetical protein [Campylobacter sp. CNRCH_2007_0968H]